MATSLEDCFKEGYLKYCYGQLIVSAIDIVVTCIKMNYFFPKTLAIPAMISFG